MEGDAIVNMKRILAFQLSLLLLGLGFVGIIAFAALFGIQRQNEIGRASCRERV